jgi:hypothetical protein
MENEKRVLVKEAKDSVSETMKTILGQDDQKYLISFCELSDRSRATWNSIAPGGMIVFSGEIAAFSYIPPA